MTFIEKNFWQYFLLIYAGVFLITNLHTNASHTEDGLELIFRQRSHSDWKDVWHQETHSRCRNKLQRHLYWACEKDIYRMTRRNGKRNYNSNNHIIEDYVHKQKEAHRWFFGDNELPQFLRTRRSPKHSITYECCTKTGCTWEEYAEYCPSNKRIMHFI